MFLERTFCTPQYCWVSGLAKCLNPAMEPHLPEETRTRCNGQPMDTPEPALNPPFDPTWNPLDPPRIPPEPPLEPPAVPILSTILRV